MAPLTGTDIVDRLEAFRGTRVLAARSAGQVLPHLAPAPLSVVLGDAALEDQEEDPNLEDARQGYQERIRTVFDGMIHGLLTELRNETEDRESRIRETLKEHLNVSFELFWGTLEAACRMPLEVKLENPLEYLDFMEELSMGFIKAYQEHPDRARLRAQIATRAAQKPPKSDDKTFRGASTPKPFPLFRQFAEACGQIPDGHRAFSALYLALKEVAETATSGLQRAQPVESCQVGWDALLGALKARHPNLKVHTSTQEYLGMVKDSTDFGVVDGRSEEELIAAFDQALEADEAANRVSVVLLGSVRRTGERIDVDTIHKALKAKHPNMIFVVDGAQDHLMYPEVDVALYSKRLGATGTGLMFLSQARFDDAFYESFNLRHGVNISSIASTLAALRCERRERHFASPLADLQNTPTLWEFVGGGNYIEYESEKVVAHVVDDPQLSQHFEATYSTEELDEGNPHIWRSSRNIALRLKSPSPLSLKTVTNKMKERGYYLDWISIKEVPEFLELLDLSTAPYSEEQCQRFFEAILKFQHGPHVTYVTEMLSLPEVFNGTAGHDQETYERQVAYLRESGGRQNMIRFLIDITKSHDAIHACLNALSEVLEELTPAA